METQRAANAAIKVPINEARTRAPRGEETPPGQLTSTSFGEMLRQAVINLLGLEDPHSGRHQKIVDMHKALAA
jgi:hypothetical protein